MNTYDFPIKKRIIIVYRYCAKASNEKLQIFLANIIYEGGLIKMNLMDLFNQNKKKASKKQAAKIAAIGAGIGTAVGVAAGVLLAPKSGKETREDITKATKETLENVKEGLNVAKEKIEEIVKKEKGCCCNEASAEEECECKEDEKA